MEIIMPAAGLSTRFPNMRPKYTLTDYSGKMMFEKAIAPLIKKHHITIGLLEEHEEKYNISKYVEQEYGDASTGPLRGKTNYFLNEYINKEFRLLFRQLKI